MFKHCFLFFSLLVCSIAVTASGYASEQMVGDILYLYTPGSGVCTAYSSRATISGDVTIADEMEFDGQTYKVTALGKYLFSGRPNVTSVTLPSTLVSIGDQAFYQSKITSIVIPEGVETIGKSVFELCRNLVSATLPSTLVSLGERAFAQSGLTAVVIPASLKTLGESAFYNCTGLVSATFAEGSKLSAIPYRAFCQCSALSQFPNIPSTATAIGAEAFRSSGVVAVSLSSNITDFGSYTFANCYSLKSVTLPETMTAIPDYFLFTATALEKVNFPSGLKSIGVAAFRQCQKLTELNLPASVEAIGENAFAWCNGAKSLMLPTSLKIVERNSFYRVSGITELYIPDNVVEVKEGGFGMCASLKELRLSENLEKIGDLAFSDINAFFSELRIPASVKEIGSKAFSHNVNSSCGVNRVRLWAEEPPLIAADTFQSYDIDVEVLNGTFEKYYAADVWQNFTNLHEGLTSGASAAGADNGDFGTDDWVEAYTLAGQLAYSGAYGSMRLDRGVYIVRSGMTVRKMAF